MLKALLFSALLKALLLSAHALLKAFMFSVQAVLKALLFSVHAMLKALFTVSKRHPVNISSMLALEMFSLCTS